MHFGALAVSAPRDARSGPHPRFDVSPPRRFSGAPPDIFLSRLRLTGSGAEKNVRCVVRQTFQGQSI